MSTLNSEMMYQQGAKDYSQLKKQCFEIDSLQIFISLVSIYMAEEEEVM